MTKNELWPVESAYGGSEYSSLQNPLNHEGLMLSFLDLVLLTLLESSPMTGYVLRKRMVTEYRLRASYGTLYPRLKAFEKIGIVKSSSVMGEFASRNTGTNYELTPSGKAVLDENLKKFEGSLRKIKSKDVETREPRSDFTKRYYSS